MWEAYGTADLDESGPSLLRVPGLDAVRSPLSFPACPVHAGRVLMMKVAVNPQLRNCRAREHFPHDTWPGCLPRFSRHWRT